MKVTVRPVTDTPADDVTAVVVGARLIVSVTAVDVLGAILASPL